MDNEAEVIRHQMEETRTNLTEKLEALEEKVVRTVEGTTETVAETVNSVKEAVQGTVEAVSTTVDKTVETVKETFDVRRQMENHPWLIFGGSVAVGFLGGKLLGSSRRPSARSSSVPSWARSAQEPAPSSSGPGWLQSVGAELKPALNKLKGLAIGGIAGMLSQSLIPAVPEPMRAQVGEVLENITTALGGTPIQGWSSDGPTHSPTV
jgi:ElaB/YqjD/DUF883 family membrane-anchored ribosome-binding protein